MITTSEAQKPPGKAFFGGFYGDNWERALDPWHRDAFPDEFKNSAPNQKGPRASGWFLLDAWGNPLVFVPDGTQFIPENYPATNCTN